MIPKGRFDEVLSKSAEKDLQIARLQGENEALKMVVKPAAPGTPTQPTTPAETHDQKLERIYAAKEALAKKFDDGELGLAEMRRQERKLDDELDQAREARLESRIKASAPQPQQTAPAPDMRLEEKFEDLETKHVYLKAPEVMRDDRWQFLLTEAASQLRSDGVLTLPEGAPLPPTLRFKLGERVALLSDTYGPIWGAKAPQPSAAPPKPGVPPVVQARANKLEQAASAPPDLNRLTPQGTQTEITEDMLASMSDDEILALPASVRAKFSTA